MDKRGCRMSISANKYNIAWFKLAECVSRGEKERALGVYRLLAHSLDDRAVASQLEGDILYTFGDKVMAKNRYDRAIAWYKHDKRFLEMAVVSEQMHGMYPHDRAYLEQLVDVYAQLFVKSKVALYLLKLIQLHISENELLLVGDLLDRYGYLLTVDMVITIRQNFVCELLKSNDIPVNFIIQEVQKAVDVLIMIDGNLRLQQFLTMVQELNEEYYVQTCDYIGRNGVRE